MSASVWVLCMKRPKFPTYPATGGTVCCSRTSRDGPPVKIIGMLIPRRNFSNFCSMQEAKFPRMKTATSCSLIKSRSSSFICEIRLPKPLAMPSILDLEPCALRYSATSQAECGRWWISRLGITTAISVPTSGDSETSPAKGRENTLSRSMSSDGMRICRITSFAMLCR